MVLYVMVRLAHHLERDGARGAPAWGGDTQTRKTGTAGFLFPTLSLTGRENQGAPVFPVFFNTYIIEYTPNRTLLAVAWGRGRVPRFRRITPIHCRGADVSLLH